jgi:hypothetical protein
VFKKEDGAVASVWFTFLVVAVVSIMMWAVFDPMLRGPLYQLIVQTVGNPVTLGDVTFDAIAIPNFVKGFFYATFWASIIIIILTPLRRTGDKYRVD